MIRSKAYKFCPECGNRYTKRSKTLKLSCPNGHTYYISPKATCCVIIKDESDKILLIKRANNPGKGLWQLPGGFITIGETLEETAKREIKEELGVDITVIDIIGGFPTVYPLNGIDYEVISVTVVGKIDKKTPRAISEVLEIRWVELEEISTLEFAFAVDKEQATAYLRRL